MSTDIDVKCTHGCRRGEDATPCRVLGGCGYQWQTVCVLCSGSLEYGHVCQQCSQTILRHLRDILRLACEAAVTPVMAQERSSGSRPVPGSRPPLNVAGLDPELTLVRLFEHDESADQPILEILESWERVIRQDRGLAPYGLASEARLEAAGPLHASTWASHTPVTLTGVVGFLEHHHVWAMTETAFDLAEYARQIALCRQALLRWDSDAKPPAWRVPCPTTSDEGECGNVLRVSRGDEIVYCRRCGTKRELANLLRVAGRDADVWVDIEAAARLAQVHEQTIRKWVRRRVVKKRGQLVRMQDIRAYIEHAAHGA